MVLLLLLACGNEPPPDTTGGPPLATCAPVAWQPPSDTFSLVREANTYVGVYGDYDGETLTARYRRDWHGPIDEHVHIDEFWHEACGDGLRGFYLFPGPAVTVGAAAAYTQPYGSLRVQVDAPGTWVLPVPVEFHITGVTALGCDGHVEGDVIATDLLLELELTPPETPDLTVEPGSDCGELLSGSGIVPRFHTPTASAANTPGSLTLQGDGVLLESHPIEPLQRVSGDGTLDVLLNGSLVHSLDVLPARDLAELSLEVFDRSGQPVVQEVAHDDATPLRLRLTPEGPDGPLCGELPVADLDFATTGPCTIEPFDDCPERIPYILPVLTASGPGTCSVDVTHVPSGFTTTRTFQVTP